MKNKVKSKILKSVVFIGVTATLIATLWLITNKQNNLYQISGETKKVASVIQVDDTFINVCDEEYGANGTDEKSDAKSF